ncbi:Sps2p NDAI_0F04510 [Naumovozyma dairenensis CBS 421]|uniref:Receptor L-domain domain-containing protein n=1 Tax=Naumovozyma dairenensis (strain ATCC 10597 / BCRC 20456 / CBS 421 / NBRC 0211 / NRRL Y-12639) TaxID=1071378 RepID=G0WDA8_NAUDC|nr:hypothetical protein NDAI_0F04510 [Naumovozyma dairenensis CBS 421]CCD25769.1 hypothetical protein NDAI_0F04510 [Naumovozyma dairenensis CBS 421]
MKLSYLITLSLGMFSLTSAKKRRLDSSQILVNSDSRVVISPNIEEKKPISEKQKLPLLEVCKHSNYFISDAEELRELQNNCLSVTGSIEILSNYTDTNVEFGNLKNIEGDLKIANSPYINKIHGNQLQNVHGKFTILNLTSVASIKLPSFIYTESIDWETLPVLTEAQIHQDISDVKNIIISDTSLSQIGRLGEIKELEIFNINNNRFLENIEMDLIRVTKELTIHANAKELELEMPNLVSVKNLTVRDTSKVSFPKLQQVNSSMEFIENFFEELEIPTLLSIDGTLGIIDNVNLKKIDLKNVTNVDGGIMVSNNSKLNKIDFLPQLRQVGGAVQLEGNFDDTDFPELKLVKGSAYIKSTSNNLDCTKWTKLVNDRSIIRGGKVSCTSDKKENSLKVNEEGEVLDKSEMIVENENTDNSKVMDRKKSDITKDKESKAAAATRLPCFGLFISMCLLSATII